MINNLIKSFQNFDDMQFNYHLDKLRYKWAKKLMLKILIFHISRNYNINTMYCSREKVQLALIKRMHLDYLF